VQTLAGRAVSGAGPGEIVMRPLIGFAAILFSGAATAASTEVALKCHLDAEGNEPPMFITIDDGSHTVQVTMAGQSYLEDTFEDGPLVWWQVKSRDKTVIRSRLNRADGTLIITNEFGPGGQNMVKGECVVAPRKF